MMSIIRSLIHIIECWTRYQKYGLFKSHSLGGRMYLEEAGLSIGDALRRRNIISSGMRFFCTVAHEHGWHRFLTCPTLVHIWKFINIVVFIDCSV